MTNQENGAENVDQRPDPKPRRHMMLWQQYLYWDELMQMKKRHTLRLSSINKGKSNMDAGFEESILETIGLMEKQQRKAMAKMGKATAGPIWDWLTGIRGIADHTAAKLIAMFDDPAQFDTISKFWRFSGWAVIDGEAERNRKGEKSHYNRRLKSECYLVGESFIKQQNAHYVPLYYEEKARLRELHPEPEPAPDSPWPTRYTDSHIHRMARRKMVKVFLAHLWLVWREIEGLPVTDPYPIAHLPNHTHMIEPPNIT